MAKAVCLPFTTQQRSTQVCSTQFFSNHEMTKEPKTSLEVDVHISEFTWQTSTSVSAARTRTWWSLKRLVMGRHRVVRGTTDNRGLAAVIIDTYAASSTIEAGLRVEIIMSICRSLNACC